MVSKTTYQKIALVAVLVVCILVIVYILVGITPPPDPNQDRIAFIVASSFPGLSGLFLHNDIYVTNVDSPGRAHIIRQPKVGTLAWLPQGDRIAYFNYRSNSLYAISTSNPAQPELLRQGIYMLHITWSPDGTKLAYSEGGGKIYIIDLFTGQEILLLGDTVKGTQPAWSPSGSKVAFTLNPYSNSPASSIAVVNTDGSNLIQLTPDDRSRFPTWSPDGSRIAFQREGNIYVMDADGSNVRPVVRDGKSYTPNWSPDGSRLAFVSAANQKCGISIADGPRFCTNELRVVNIDGSNMVVVRGRANESYSSPAWAPRN
jgi:Tol biopolymer transport system component